MTARPLPPGAHPIAQARQQGLKPDGDVIVSFVGLTPWLAPHVFPKTGIQYDWDWSEELPLVIVMKPGIDASDAIRGCYWPANPRQLLTLIDIESRHVSYVVEMLPKPKLWHLKDVSEYFPEVMQ